MTTKHPIPLVHPGDIIREDFVKALNLSGYRVARDCQIPTAYLYELLKGKRPVSAQVALKLGRYFGVNPQWFLNMQAFHDLRLAEREFGERIARTVKPLAA
jgi:addiction module HigA family antidote